MLPSRFTSGQSSVVRKSRFEGKPSLLPKPRRPCSTDRLSVEARRPSTTGHRSSSAEPRSTLAGSRLSKEASTTKLPLNGRSRSQQGDRYGQSSVTPLRSSQYSFRPTITPVRTPSEDRTNRSWQSSLDRALAFVTIKDQRPISNPVWIRAETARVGEALAARGGGGGATITLMRPLTIARFVEITGALLSSIIKEGTLNNDNYVAKLPNLSKRLLYPGTVSKSWLKTVNTLHAFPHALALISYLLDLTQHLEMPVLDEWLYVGKDELSRLRREYLYKSWLRFQDTDHQFEDLNEEYLLNLRALLGNDEQKIAELQEVISKKQALLEDEAELTARADEARRSERREALLQALRAERGARRDLALVCAAQKAMKNELAETMRQLDLDIERANTESQQLKLEVEGQAMTVAERTKLLDEVDYAHRVLDSKRALAEQIAKMVLGKERELALWQKKSLDSCLEYKQGLIHLSAQFPQLSSLAIDEKELMSAECAQCVSRAGAALRECANMLAERRGEHARAKAALARRRNALAEEIRSKISEMKASIQREQQTLDDEVTQENSEASSWSVEIRTLRERLEEVSRQQHQYAAVEQDLEYWEKQYQQWNAKIAPFRKYVETVRSETQRRLAAIQENRTQCILQGLKLWYDKLPQRD